MLQYEMELTAAQKAELFDTISKYKYEVMISIDREDGMAWTMEARDPVWAKTMGSRYVFDEMIRMYLMDVMLDVDSESILQRMTLSSVLEKLAASGGCSIQYIIRNETSSPSVKMASYYPAGEKTIVLCIQDISENARKVEESLSKLRRELSEARQEISEKTAFLSMLDQHLRAPIYSIMGLTHIAEETPEPHAFDDYLRKISMSGSYMQETIDDLLSLRQIASHQMSLHPVAIDLMDFFSNVERMIRPSIYGKGLLFEMDTSNIASLQIMADVRCLQQIVMKMLRSAIDYTVKGGRIRLHARSLFHNEQEMRLELSVENRGIVIDQERLSVLLKPYGYLKSRLGESLGDLDIALIILRSSVLAMGSSTITAESDERRGTKITVTLSVPLVPSQDRQELRHEIPDFHGKRVLLVDDNNISLEVSERLLANKGIQVVTAHNGQEALEYYVGAKGNFDLILMDVLMPVMDGLEATRRIREMKDIPGAATIPIIALTVNAFRENFEESLMAGMNAHLVKPLEPEMLYQVLMTYLGGAE